MTLLELVETISETTGLELGTEDDAFVLIVPQEDRRSQRVRVAEFVSEDQTFIRFTSGIGSESRFDPARAHGALIQNLRLPYGAIALDGDQLVITDTIPLSLASVDMGSEIIRSLARQADAYEKSMHRTDEL